MVIYTTTFGDEVKESSTKYDAFRTASDAMENGSDKVIIEKTKSKHDERKSDQK